VPNARFARFAGVVLILTGSLAHAADEHMRVELVTVEAPAESKARTIAKRVIALPVELVGLFIGHRAETPTIAGWPVATTYVADATVSNWDLPSNLLPPAPLARGDMVELDLSESRVALWLSDDFNLQCDLDQDPAIARGDQFTLKLGMQFRFR